MDGTTQQNAAANFRPASEATIALAREVIATAAKNPEAYFGDKPQWAQNLGALVQQLAAGSKDICAMYPKLLGIVRDVEGVDIVSTQRPSAMNAATIPANFPRTIVQEIAERVTNPNGRAALAQICRKTGAYLPASALQ